MHSLKFVLPLAGLLMAAQALAHNASRDAAPLRSPARPVLVEAGIHPAALLDGVDGRSAQAASAMAAAEAAQAAGKKHRYTKSH